MLLKNLSARLLPLLPAALLLGPTLSLCAADATDASSTRLAAPKLQKSAHGVIIPVGDKFLNLEVCADDVIHVSCAADTAYFRHPSLAVLADRDVRCAWSLRTEAGKAVITTSKLQLRVALATGDISFFNSSNQLILAEAPGGRTWTPAIVQGEQTYHVRQEWQPNDDEALYGLGQHQLGLMNIKGYDLDLWQFNATVAIPFLVSSRGYGILWDNTSFSRFGDLREFEPVPAAKLFGADGNPGGLSGSYYRDSQFERRVAQRRDPTVDFAVPGDAKSPN